MPNSPIEQLITMDASASSDDRRAMLRQVTDPFIVAADRYGRRDMVLFDLLFSRTACAMDQGVRRLLAMALLKVGAREEHIRTALSTANSPNERLLRRTTTQSRDDLLQFLMEGAVPANVDGDPGMTDGNSVTLPSLLTHWTYQFQLAHYCDQLAPKIGKDRTEALRTVSERHRPQIVSVAEETGRDEIIVARRTVNDWARRQTITDNILAELLEARAMTEFIFAAVTMFNFDVPTFIRILNDYSFESLAITCRANGVRRSVFAKILSGFSQRRTDAVNTDRILGIYDRIPQEVATRVIRFWRVRVSEITDDREFDFAAGLKAVS